MNNIEKVAEDIWYLRKFKSLLPIILGIVLGVLALLFIISMFFTKYGGLYISSPKDVLIADNRYFKDATHKLDCKAPQYVAAGTDIIIPAYVDQVDGEHNGDDYLAYTFYCKNITDADMSIELQCNIINTTIIGKYLHVTIYDNGIEYDHKIYQNEPRLTIEHNTKLISNEAHKFTIVMWFEIDFMDNNLQTTDTLNANLQIVKLSD